jgi:hypothetical protein
MLGIGGVVIGAGFAAIIANARNGSANRALDNDYPPPEKLFRRP